MAKRLTVEDFFRTSCGVRIMLEVVSLFACGVRHLKNPGSRVPGLVARMVSPPEKGRCIPHQQAQSKRFGSPEIVEMFLERSGTKNPRHAEFQGFIQYVLMGVMHHPWPQSWEFLTMYSFEG